MEELLRTLIGFPTVSEDPSIDDALTYIANFVKKRGLHVQRYRSNGSGSLIATTRAGDKHPKVLLAAHLDVVPGSNTLFRLREHDGKYYGRGVFDMKFAIAAYLHAIDKLGKKVTDYSFGLMITTDEEASGEYGTKYLLEQGFGADICLLPDGADGWRIESDAKGSWRVYVEAIGKTSHGSRPWEGENAAEKILSFLAAVQSQVPPAKKHTDTTVVVSVLQAGDAMNQVPGLAWAGLDIRFMDDDEYEKTHVLLTKLAKAHDVNLRTEMLARAVHHNVRLPLVQRWEGVVQNVHGEVKGDYALSFGASDARYFIDSGVPTIITRPDGGGAHSEDEWIDKTGVNQFADCIVQYLELVAN